MLRSQQNLKKTNRLHDTVITQALIPVTDKSTRKPYKYAFHLEYRLLAVHARLREVHLVTAGTVELLLLAEVAFFQVVRAVGSRADEAFLVKVVQLDAVVLPAHERHNEKKANLLYLGWPDVPILGKIISYEK